MSRVVQLVAAATLLLSACGGEFQFNTEPPPPPAEPPGKEGGGGAPPDWQDCFQGWRGVYSNLSVDHPDVRPRLGDPTAGTDPTALDWWDRRSYEKFDATLDFGQNWWPVDEGLQEDPAFFAVYWHAWIRAWSNTDLEFTLGSSDDSWVWIDGAPLAEKPGIQDFTRDTYRVSLSSGQYPIEVWFAHRASATSGFSFRVMPNEDISICYPDFADGEE